MMYDRWVDGRRVVKGVYEIPLPLETITNYQDNITNVMVTDSMCISAKSLVKDGEFEICHFTYKAPWPLSNRDFVTLRRKFVDGDKVYYLNKSYDYGVPEVNGVVRGELVIGSFCIEKIGENKCRVTYISQSDPKGDVPEAMKNMAAKRQSEMPINLYKGIQSKK